MGITAERQHTKLFMYTGFVDRTSRLGAYAARALLRRSFNKRKRVLELLASMKEKGAKPKVARELPFAAAHEEDDGQWVPVLGDGSGLSSPGPLDPGPTTSVPSDSGSSHSVAREASIGGGGVHGTSGGGTEVHGDTGT